MALGAVLGQLRLAITHEIDSAFTREWDLFHIPGSLQIFLAVKLVLVMTDF